MPKFYFILRQMMVNMPRRVKQILAVVLDTLLLFAAFHLALWLRFELFFFDTTYLFYSLLACVGGVTALGSFGIYRYVLRYMDERVVLAIISGVVVSIMLITAAETFLQVSKGLSRGVLVIYGLLAVAALLSMRYCARKILFPRTPAISDNLRIPVVIYGAGGAGSQLVKALQAGPHYRVTALIDDDVRKQGLVISGVRVHAPAFIARLISRFSIRQLLIAMPTASPSRIRHIAENMSAYQLRLRLVPSLRELVDQPNGSRLRDLKIEDLLGRDSVAPMPMLLGRCVTGRNVMVTGAGGSIGSELCRQILALKPKKLVLFEISEPSLYLIEQELLQWKNQVHSDSEIISMLGTVRDPVITLQSLVKHKIQTVYHAAAYKHVPIVESNVCEGVLNNAFGTLTLAQAAIDAQVNDFVLISTDKAVRPTNVMGATKRLAEMVLQGLANIQHNTRFSMVRFGNVLGSSGSVVPLFQKQILSGGPITLTHQGITRYFMTIPEAAQLVLQAGSMGDSGSVFVLDMGKPVRIIDLAQRMVQLYGLTLRNESQPDGDIAINITGLRPGEKLYEELLIGGDITATEHPQIMKAREKCLEYTELMTAMKKLKEALIQDDTRTVVSILAGLVDDFQPAANHLTAE